MHPTLPLVRASIRDLMESMDYLLTEGWEKDKTYSHDHFDIYTYDGQSIILVDTTQPRTFRLCVTVNTRKSVVIKDATGLANINPILITLVPDGEVVLSDNPERQFKLYCPYGAVELSAYHNSWTFTVPRSTCISMRGFRLPQNLNFALPPAIGSARQHFESLAYFPARMAGKDITPPGYNGFTASVHEVSQIKVPDPATSGLTDLFRIPDVPAGAGTTFTELTIVKDVTFNVPGDFPDLASAIAFLAKKTIMAGVTVTLAFGAASAITGLVQINHPQASQIILKGITPRLFVPANTRVFSSIPGEVLVNVQLSRADYELIETGDVLLVDQARSNRRFGGAWRVIAKIPDEAANVWNIRLRLTDYGASFPNLNVALPGQSRWRMARSVITMLNGGELKVFSDGLRIYDLAFVGEGGDANALGLYAHTVLDNVAVTGFTGCGIDASSARAILDSGDLYSCSNGIGLRLGRGAALNGTQLFPGVPNKTTEILLSGNTDSGLLMTGSRAYGSPLHACGNAKNGISLDKAAHADINNSSLAGNGQFGLLAGANSTGTGSFNSITGNGEFDIKVDNAALVRMVTSSALRLSSPNQTTNEDGSRIDIS